MPEARRFLRYVAPGIVYAVVTILLLLILFQEWTLGWLAGFAGSAQVGAIVGAFLASGGVGFLFSTIHHGLHWWLGNVGSDHRDCINALITSGVISPRSIHPQTCAVQPLTRHEAWAFLSAVWYQRLDSSIPIKAATQRTIELADLMHTLGTARIAVAAAALTTIWIGYSIGEVTWTTDSVVRAIVAAVVFLSLIYMFQRAYARTARFARYVIEQVLVEALHRERQEGRTALTAYPPTWWT